MLRKMLALLLITMFAGCGVTERPQQSVDATLPGFEDGVCGTEDPSPEQIAGVQQALARFREMSPPAPVGPKTIAVYMWVMRKGAAGAVSAAQATQLIESLNKEIGRTDYVFRLDGRTEITDHPEWYVMSPNSAEETAVKKAYRKGNGGTLNIWTADPGVSDDGTNLAGYATPCKTSSKNGVVVEPSLVNSATAIHEVGHWMGLYHIFRNGCSAINDLIDDTPQQKEKGKGCPTGADTCPDPEKDPITNYMNYGTCRTVFTADQYDHMLDLSLAGASLCP